jgi:hypothetical protein
MSFLCQTFTLVAYYNMFKTTFDRIGNNYYKGLKNKLPPIRYMGLDENNNELVMLAHPRDFNRHIKILKYVFNNCNTLDNLIENIKLENIKDDILEIYPAKIELVENPNGFIGLFINEKAKEILMNEFNENDEIACLNFLKVGESGIEIDNHEFCGVIETFILKFNSKLQLINKYKNLYLVIGEIKDLNMITGETYKTNKYNIIGGKRTIYENSIESTIRETQEELGLNIETSKIYRLISKLLPNTNDIIKCSSFNVYCIYIKEK